MSGVKIPQCEYKPDPKFNTHLWFFKVIKKEIRGVLHSKIKRRISLSHVTLLPTGPTII